MHVTKHRALALFTVLALAACSGKDGTVGAKGDKGDAGAAGAAGANGVNGTNGVNGVNGVNGTNGKDATALQTESCEICHAGAGPTHQSYYDLWVKGLKSDTTALAVTVDSVVSTVDSAVGVTPVTYKSVITFTLKKNGAPYVDTSTDPRTTLGDGSVNANFGVGLYSTQQKTIYAAQWDAVKGQVLTATAFSYGKWKLIDAATGKYTAEKAGVKFQPENSTSGFVYGYFGDKLLFPAKGHYNLMNNIVSFATNVAGVTGFTSAANVSGCEKCHQAPYSKHGYRQATVAGLPDFVACKVCHTGSRVGSDHDWQIMADDPVTYAAIHAGTATITTALKTKYNYTASVMNDTHMSHAMEFEYPQSMSNCITCHAGKLDRVLTDANFTLETCKSCHPVTGPTTLRAGRAPALNGILKNGSLAQIHTMDLYEPYAGPACNSCHNSVQKIGRVFSAVHQGFDNTISKDATGAKYSASITSAVDSATFDAATNKLTVKFSVAGAATGAVIKPTVVMSIYGYGTKDMLVSGHSGQPDGTTNLEWTEGATQRADPTKSSNSSRLAVTPNATAGNTTWTAVADLSLWSANIGKSMSRIEVGFLPALGLDQTKAVGSTNPAIAIKGVSKTFDLVAKALVADDKAYGRAIVDPEKCNKCHDALGTSFHSPSYGSAGVVGCRLCHTVQTGGSHLEMQSRSIDSYVHAIHSFQAFDIQNIKFKTDPTAQLWYDLTIESTYPNFAITNCESCHVTGTYDVPDQTKSMPGILSASAKNSEFPSWRTIGTVDSFVTGPASRACGSCHRAEMIKESDAAKLASFDSHTAAFSTQVPAGTAMNSVNTNAMLDQVIQYVFSWFK